MKEQLDISSTNGHKEDVTFYSEASCYLAEDVVIGGGTVILPNSILEAGVVIGPGCTIGPNVHLKNAVVGAGVTVNSSQIFDSKVGDNALIGPFSYLKNAEIGQGATINASQIYDSTVGQGTAIGPFAHLRPNSHLGEHCRVGNFVEVKNSQVGNGTKISHLTYVGDSDVGERVNFGCGTVTVNYDGKSKYRTTIGDDVFVGCNTNLVAPVTVGDGSYTAAGSTITEDVPSNALGIARARQVNKENWMDKHKSR